MGGFSLSGASHCRVRLLFLGASCCREGTSHCQEEFAVGMFLYSVGKGCGHIRAAHELSHVLCTTLMELLSVGQSTSYPSRISL